MTTIKNTLHFNVLLAVKKLLLTILCASLGIPGGLAV
jgi:hypothetical protein